MLRRLPRPRNTTTPRTALSPSASRTRSGRSPSSARTRLPSTSTSCRTASRLSVSHRSPAPFGHWPIGSAGRIPSVGHRNITVVDGPEDFRPQFVVFFTASTSAGCPRHATRREAVRCQRRRAVRSSRALCSTVLFGLRYRAPSRREDRLAPVRPRRPRASKTCATPHGSDETRVILQKPEDGPRRWSSRATSPTIAPPPIVHCDDSAQEPLTSEK